MAIRDPFTGSASPSAPVVLNGLDGDRIMLRVAPTGGIASVHWANSTAGPWYAYLGLEDAPLTVADGAVYQNRLEAAPFMRVSVDAGTAAIEAYLQGGLRP